MRSIINVTKVKNTSVYLAVTLFSSCGLIKSISRKSETLGAGLAAVSEGFKINKNPLRLDSSFDASAPRYVVAINDVPVGTAVATLGKGSDASLFEMKILHRIGATPLITEWNGKANLIAQGPRKIEQTIKMRSPIEVVEEQSQSWEESGKKFVANLGKRQSLPSMLSLPVEKNNADISLEMNLNAEQTLQLPFFKPQGEAENYKIFSPFSGKFVNFDKENPSKFDGDGILISGKILWYGELGLSFQRVSDEELVKISDDLLRNPIDLAWLSPDTKTSIDLKTLAADSENCLSFSEDAETLVKKKFPQVPYLMHRKIFNFQKICRGIDAQLRSNTRPGAVIDNIGQIVAQSLTEDVRELPRAFVTSPDIAVFNEPKRKVLWVRSLSNILRETHNEMAELLAIEQVQKVSVNFKVVLDKLTRGAVVKGSLHSMNLDLKETVEVSSDPQMKPTSLKVLPESLQKKLKELPSKTSQNIFRKVGMQVASTGPFEYLNAQSYAAEELASPGLICEAQGGQIGLDLGDAPNKIFTSAISRGLWDHPTRLSLIRDFARHAATNAKCKSILIRVPMKMHPTTVSEMESFKRDVLQSESEFQISNGSAKKMRLVPGRYELVLSSLVSGAVLSRREIIIPDGIERALMVTVK